MKITSGLFRFMLSVSALFVMINFTQAQNKYIGADKCKMCHNKPDKGAQYDKWKSSKHSNSNTAKDVAGKAECEKCHAPVADFKAEGVTCEVCHGAGEKYKAMAIMKVKDDAIKNGMIIPTEASCKNCHDATKAPKGHKTFTFDFKASSEKIKHGK